MLKKRQKNKKTPIKTPNLAIHKKINDANAII